MLFLGWIISDQGEIIQKSRINSNPSMPIDTKLKKIWMRWMPHTAMCEGIALLSPLLSLTRCAMMNPLVKFLMPMITKKWHSDDPAMVEGVFDLLVSEICIAGEIILVDLGINEIKYHFILYTMHYTPII